MSKLDVTTQSPKACFRCGAPYTTYYGYFPTCYSDLYKGVGYLPVCKKCLADIYVLFLAECNDQNKAARQTCRKFNLYWNQEIFDSVCRKHTDRSVMGAYISKLNAPKNAGKSYEDTLREENSIWYFTAEEMQEAAEASKPEGPSDAVVAFWGPGYTPEMYEELEQRLNYYRSHLDDVDRTMNTDALLRQIAMLEIDINRARAEGRSVDKMVTTLNSLLSSLAKPSKDNSISSAEKTPFGVWIRRFEDERPIPEPDEEFKDVDHIVRYISIWFLGHLCKMLNIKNTYSKLYEDEIARLRVDRPEYDDEDDESMIADIFGDSGQDGGDAE